MLEQDKIPPSREALREAFELSGQLLNDLETSTTSLTSIALKTGRLARLLSDFDVHSLMEYECGGYPHDSDGMIRHDAFELGRMTVRVSTAKDPKTGKVTEQMPPVSIGELESKMALTNAALAAAIDSDAPAPPGPFAIQGNTFERNAIRQTHYDAARQIAKTRAFIYDYVSRTHYELKLSGIANDVFARIRERVDRTIGTAIPGAVRKMTAVYDNLQSDNPEDWSNAVHGCRRLLQDLADAVFPARTDEHAAGSSASGKSAVKLGKENYTNRLIAFVQASSTSGRFTDIVGSQLNFLGDRLDAVFRAAQKGSHSDIVSREEADRYVIYTYLLVGDLLSLLTS
jgi:hypothetical protein